LKKCKRLAACWLSQPLQTAKPYEQVRKLMEAIDMDCDGVVTVEELRTWVRNQARQKEVQSTPKPVSSFRLFLNIF
jgi:Ca2+-binding EF-hand superfamily protein